MRAVVFSLLLLSAPSARADDVTESSAAAGPRAGPLALGDALQLVLASHPDLAAAADVVEGAAIRPERFFDPLVPRLLLNSGASIGQNPVLGPFFTHFVGQQVSVDQRAWVGVGVRTQSPFGTEASLVFDNSVLYSSYFTTALSPAYTPSLRLTLSQRLLQGASPEAFFAGRNAALALSTTADVQLRRVEQSLLAGTAEAWLDVARGEALVALRASSLDLARNLQRLTNELVNGGQLSKLDLALGEQQVFAQQVALEAARATRDLAARALAARLALEGDVVPVLPDDALADVERWAPTSQDLASATAIALERSPDLAGFRADRARLDAELKGAENAALPDIRVSLSASTSGLAGTSQCRDGFYGDGLTPCFVPDQFNSGYDRALLGMVTGQLYGATLSLEGTIPMSLSPLSADARARAVELRAVDHRIRARGQSLTWDTRQHWHDLRARALLVTQTRETSRLSRDAVTAEEQKFRAGRSTTLAVQQAQQLLIDARAREIDALVDLGRAGIRYHLLIDDLRPAMLAAATPPMASTSSTGIAE